MTVVALVRVWNSEEVGQVSFISPVGDAALDSSLSAEQVEAIVRGWKGEAIEGSTLMSPVGEMDRDGTLFLGKLNARESYANKTQPELFPPCSGIGDPCDTCATMCDTCAAVCTVHRSWSNSCGNQFGCC